MHIASYPIFICCDCLSVYRGCNMLMCYFSLYKYSSKYVLNPKMTQYLGLFLF